MKKRLNISPDSGNLIINAGSNSTNQTEQAEDQWAIWTFSGGVVAMMPVLDGYPEKRQG